MLQSSETVFVGIDVLDHRSFAPLHGRRIGLITNATGLNHRGQATADLIRSQDELRLNALFGPEHGIRGAVDEAVPDSQDTKTGLPVYSLYGERTRPTPEQLTALDLLVYDIQDIGVRFYTYISTLLACLEAAAEARIPFLVLDRPNPLGGMVIEGPIADADRLDFTACHPLPIRHGLTVGELARLFVAERAMEVALEVIPVEGWRRDRLWDATGLMWTDPSPNMRSLTEALLYPGVGLLEFTNLSVGRGTCTPFEVVGAPWIDGCALASALNARDLPGIRFVPIRFTPEASRYAGEKCEGVNLIITSRQEFTPVLSGLALAEILLRQYPEVWEFERYLRLLAHRQTFEALRSGAAAEALTASFSEDLERFRVRCRPHLLYEP